MKLLTYLLYTLLITTMLSCGIPADKGKLIDTLEVENPDSVVNNDTLIVVSDTINN
mgnify:FL=1|tara:strand:+ start:258 stop:425 length:168 start_codon:yes stop_codon:yes gene_type:complete